MEGGENYGAVKEGVFCSAHCDFLSPHHAHRPSCPSHIATKDKLLLFLCSTPQLELPPSLPSLDPTENPYLSNHYLCMGHVSIKLI